VRTSKCIEIYQYSMFWKKIGKYRNQTQKHIWNIIGEKFKVFFFLIMFQTHAYEQQSNVSEIILNFDYK
jgi:hypothetical protein